MSLCRKDEGPPQRPRRLARALDALRPRRPPHRLRTRLPLWKVLYFLRIISIQRKFSLFLSQILM